MDPGIVSLLCDPVTHTPVQLDPESDSLISAYTGRRYPLRNGIPVFLAPIDVTGPNRKYQTMYDRFAPGYDLVERIYYWFSRKPTFRLEFLKELEIVPSAQILEVSVGTGANLSALSAREHAGDIRFFGLDLSWEMLRRCQLNSRRWPHIAHLSQGQAERLPYRDATFDCVFHAGGINFFSGKTAAIHEMIRVAKPGTKIVIVDETDKAIRDNHQKNPFARSYFAKGMESVTCPIDLVPQEMEEIEAHPIANGKLYCLTFRKPRRALASSGQP